jgi:hypothetical protein
MDPMAPEDLEDLLTKAALARRLAMAIPDDPIGLRLAQPLLTQSRLLRDVSGGSLRKQTGDFTGLRWRLPPARADLAEVLGSPMDQTTPHRGSRDTPTNQGAI